MKEKMLEMLKEYDASAAAYIERGEARLVVFHSTYFAVWFIDGTKRWNYIIREDGVHSVY